MSHVTFFSHKLLKLVGGGSVINGAYLVYFVFPLFGPRHQGAAGPVRRGAAASLSSKTVISSDQPETTWARLPPLPDSEEEYSH